MSCHRKSTSLLHIGISLVVWIAFSWIHMAFGYIIERSRGLKKKTGLAVRKDRQALTKSSLVFLKRIARR